MQVGNLYNVHGVGTVTVNRLIYAAGSEIGDIPEYAECFWINGRTGEFCTFVFHVDFLLERTGKTKVPEAQTT